MAGAWHGGVEGAEQYVQDPVIQSAISIGMDWWFIRDFTNPACLDSGGTPACPCNANETKLFNTNWFSNVSVCVSPDHPFTNADYWYSGIGLCNLLACK
jgi:hypothetical protein